MPLDELPPVTLDGLRVNETSDGAFTVTIAVCEVEPRVAVIVATA